MQRRQPLSVVLAEEHSNTDDGEGSHGLKKCLGLPEVIIIINTLCLLWTTTLSGYILWFEYHCW